MSELKMNAKIHNRYDIFVKNVLTGEEKQVAQAENILLNQFWTDGFFNTNNFMWFGYIAFGSGTGTLSPSRTDLFTPVAYLTAGSPVTSYDPTTKTWSRRKQITLTETQYVGTVLSEVGIRANTAKTVTHALLKDMNGNPVSITKTNTDIITIYATVYAKIDTPTFDSDHLRILNSGNTSYYPVIIDWLLGDALTTNKKNYFSTIRSPLCTESDSALNFLASSGTPTYGKDGANKKITLTCPRLAVGSGNAAGGIYSVHFWFGLHVDFLDATGFAGSYVVDESIGTGDGTTVDFKSAYGLIKSGAIVKVNGVEDATATVDLNKPYSNNLLKNLKLIDFNHSKMFPGLNTNYMSGITSGAYSIYENPYYGTYGIDSFSMANATVHASNDLTNWTQVGSATSLATVNVNATYRNYRYFKFVSNSTSSIFRLDSALSSDLTTAALKDVHLQTAPASGATITLSYTTKVVVKDIYHVFDCALSVTFEEYTP